jgi:hypothetical protein
MLVNSIPVYIIDQAYDIAASYLKAKGVIPREFGFCSPLFDWIVRDFRAGNMNKLRLANRAIAHFEKAHTLELIP